MEKQLALYWATFPHQKQLFEAKKFKHESLAQWAARLTKLGEDCDYEDIMFLDNLLRDKFVAGLDPGPMQEHFAGKSLHAYTFKQVLDEAFTTAAMYEKQQKAKQKVLAKKK